MTSADKLLQELYDLVKQRRHENIANSYTVSLFKKGRARIAQKVGEEAIETVIAALKDDKKELIDEVSDLIYHVLVLLADSNVELQEIIFELQKRRMKRDHDRD